MSHTPVIIKVGDVRLAAVFKTEELDQGIEMLMDFVLPDKACARKIIVGPATSATDALLHNERCEKKAKEKGATALRADDYEENRKKVFRQE
jgi:hypothetical protein